MHQDTPLFHAGERVFSDLQILLGSDHDGGFGVHRAALPGMWLRRSIFNLDFL
jgi:hypothetical protein